MLLEFFQVIFVFYCSLPFEFKLNCVKWIEGLELFEAFALLALLPSLAYLVSEVFTYIIKGKTFVEELYQFLTRIQMT